MTYIFDHGDFYRACVVQMLNFLGDQSSPCASNGCEGCHCDAEEAMREGLESLGYETWADFHDAEILAKP